MKQVSASPQRQAQLAIAGFFRSLPWSSGSDSKKDAFFNQDFPLG
jgi:hypothetical protein